MQKYLPESEATALDVFRDNSQFEGKIFKESRSGKYYQVVQKPYHPNQSPKFIIKGDDGERTGDLKDLSQLILIQSMASATITSIF
ncbi:MAG: hypothetical protein WC533_04085 [Candidatus Pacearchaeota archaeon]